MHGSSLDLDYFRSPLRLGLAALLSPRVSRGTSPSSTPARSNSPTGTKASTSLSALSGATDVVVIQHPCGTRHASPFHILFGRFKVPWRDPNHQIHVHINQTKVPFLMRMNVDGTGDWIRDSDVKVAMPNSMVADFTPQSLTPYELECLPLRPGLNDLVYSTVSRAWMKPDLILRSSTSSPDLLQKPKFETVSARIWLFQSTSRIVVSDVDGTVTKSDALGILFSSIRVNYAHDGIAQLYRAIHDNGYEFVYLTSRGIAQAQATRDYLESVKQIDKSGACGGNFWLPKGPILTSPDGIISALKREVVTKTPAQFKIKTLQMLKDLFPAPPGHSVFVAGFGNRATDMSAYTAVGIPKTHQFHIESSGMFIKYPESSDRQMGGDDGSEQCQPIDQTYSTLTTKVSHMFPVLEKVINK